jgi:tetratricopeptide (TPR) repeat protein
LLISLAWVLGIEALDEPVKAAPPLAWLVPATLAGALLCAGMAWGCAVRRAWVLYAGLALGAVPLLVGLAAALGTRGAQALLALAAGLAGTALITLLHMAVAGELRGELRQISSAPAATSAAGLFEAGRGCYRRGLIFLAARHWARASAKDSSNPTYLHALALALAQLGLRERARAIIQRALELAPGHPELSELSEQLGKPG